MRIFRLYAWIVDQLRKHGLDQQVSIDDKTPYHPLEGAEYYPLEDESLGITLYIAVLRKGLGKEDDAPRIEFSCQIDSTVSSNDCCRFILQQSQELSSIHMQRLAEVQIPDFRQHGNYHSGTISYSQFEQAVKILVRSFLNRS